MIGKSSVSALQEYCAKTRQDSPTYDWINAEEGNSFVCQVEVLGMTALGHGRSKRDAKHTAAANVIKKLRLNHPDIDEIPQILQQDEIPATDMIVALRDYCVLHQHPLPTFDFVQQAGTPDAPEFTALCQIATIKRYGVSEKKKDARQKAAYEMLRAIIDGGNLEEHMQVATLQAKAEDIESERYRKFKTYRELTESNTGDVPGVLLCDRHNYFTKFYVDLKKGAYEVLNSTYETYKEQAMEIFRALKLKPKIKTIPSTKTTELLVFIELNCDYDAVFVGLESNIYKNVVDYFRDMLS